MTQYWKFLKIFRFWVLSKDIPSNVAMTFSKPYPTILWPPGGALCISISSNMPNRENKISVNFCVSWKYKAVSWLEMLGSHWWICLCWKCICIQEWRKMEFFFLLGTGDVLSGTVSFLCDILIKEWWSPFSRFLCLKKGNLVKKRTGISYPATKIDESCHIPQNLLCTIILTWYSLPVSQLNEEKNCIRRSKEKPMPGRLDPEMMKTSKEKTIYLVNCLQIVNMLANLINYCGGCEAIHSLESGTRSAGIPTVFV